MKQNRIINNIENNNLMDKISLTTLMSIAFGLYIVIVFWAVLFKCNMNYILEEGYLGLMDAHWTKRIFFFDDFYGWFKRAAEGDILNSDLITAALNCLLLLPFGVCCMHFSKRKSILLTTLFALLFCLVIEVIQLHTFWGFFSFDDLFTNTLGGFLGAILYRIIYRQEREGIFKGIAIVCIAILAPLTVYAAIRTGMDMDFYLSLANRTYG